jgi:hypothetical protein
MRITDTGNVGVGTNNPINVVQVGSGSRLRIANDITDYSMIGTNDTDGANNSQIVVSGVTRTGYLGSIQYYTSATREHIFSTAGGTQAQKMRINSIGNVGIGTNDALNLLEIKKASYTGALLSLDAGVASAGAGVMS